MTTWRPMQASDLAPLQAAHARQCGAMGVEFAFPELADPRYLLARVAERGGKVVGAVVFHATLEAMFVGGDAAMARAAVARRQEFEKELRWCGADEVHAFVPRGLLRSMEPLLRRLGFRRSNPEYVAYYREVE